jgi:hypothetical protein
MTNEERFQEHCFYCRKCKDALRTVEVGEGTANRYKLLCRIGKLLYVKATAQLEREKLNP